ncbi:MAG: hypothetical protein QW594_02235 [Candidatus Woesearchaeota archaeon]
MRKYLIISFFFLFLFVVAGCGEKPECKNDLDCTAGACFVATCNKGACQQTPIDNCCGNKIKEQIESGKPGNSCTCPKDYGACSLDASIPKDQTKYFMAYCTNGNNADSICRIDTNSSMQEEQRSTHDLLSDSAKTVKATIVFPTPFNAKKDLFTFHIEPKQLSGIDGLKLLTIKGTATKPSGQKISVLDIPVNRNIWSAGESITIKAPLILSVPELSTQFKQLTFTFDFETLTREKTKIESKTTANVLGKDGLVVIMPPFSYLPSDCGACDDNNPGTTDECPEGMAYCLNIPITQYPVKGNFVCDPGENRCTAPMDCGPCQGKFSQSLRYACQANKCVLGIDPVLYQKKTLVASPQEKEGATVSITYEAMTPTDVQKDTIKISLKLLQIKDDTILLPLEIKTITLSDKQNNLIATASYEQNNAITAVGESKSFVFTLQDYYINPLLRETNTDVKFDIRARITKLKKTTQGQEPVEVNALYSGSFSDLVFVKSGEIS